MMRWGKDKRANQNDRAHKSKSGRRALTALLATSGLAGCAGGGSELVVVPAPPPALRPALLPDPPSGSPATAWSNSNEYRAANGLSMIRAAEAYATTPSNGRVAGAGVRVAVTDTGLDLQQTQFENPERYVFQTRDIPLQTDDSQGHGTHVAGTIAARRDGTSVHGVAYNAQIVSLTIIPSADVRPGEFVNPIIGTPSASAAAIYSAAGLDRTVPAINGGGSPFFFTNNLGFPEQDSVKSNPAARAQVINMSWGGPDPIPLTGGGRQILDALIAAAGQNVALVAALGNDARVGASSAPAQYATDPRMNGMFIAVGALNSAGTGPAAFSNTCGALAQQCVFAPGSQITSTYINGGTAALSGTSMAAPHVSGALAVLLAAFPTVAPRDIVHRLLVRSDDMGAPGVDPIYGWGKINLERAMSPNGPLSVAIQRVAAPLPLNAREGVGAITLPGGFDSTFLRSSLSNVLIHDEDGFPFNVDMGGVVREAPAPSRLERFLNLDGAAYLGAHFGTHTQVQLTEAVLDLPDGVHLAELLEEEASQQAQDARVSWTLGPNASLALQFGALSGELGQSIGHGRAQNAFVETSAAAFANASTGSAASFTTWLDERSALTVGYQNIDNNNVKPRATLATIGLSREFEGARFGLTGGLKTLFGGPLGLTSGGLFGERTLSRESFLDLGFERDLGAGMSFGIAYTSAWTEVENGGGLVEGWHIAPSHVATLSLEAALSPTSSFSISAAAPLTDSSVTLDLSVPTHEDMDRRVVFENSTIRLGQRDAFVVQSMFDIAPEDARWSLKMGGFFADGAGEAEIGGGLRYALRN